MVESWDTDEDGNIIARTVTAFTVAPFPDYDRVLFRLEVATSDTERENIQIAMQTDHCADLAADMRLAVDHVVSQQPVDAEPTIRQSTIADIVDTERRLVLEGEQRYGEFATHAFECSLYLSKCVKSLDRTRWIFASFLSQVKKYHTLALFSTLRLHEIQSALNLRVVLEAGAFAAFAIANPGDEHFVKKKKGLMVQTKDLSARMYKWLGTNYGPGSDRIKAMKDMINDSNAHSNLLFAMNTSEFVTAETQKIDAPIFDKHDAYFVKRDLWRLGSAAIAILDLFYGVNSKDNPVVFVDGFADSIIRLQNESERLRLIMTSSGRHKAAELKAKELEEASAEE